MCNYAVIQNKTVTALHAKILPTLLYLKFMLFIKFRKQPLYIAHCKLQIDYSIATKHTHPFSSNLRIMLNFSLTAFSTSAERVSIIPLII